MNNIERRDFNEIEKYRVMLMGRIIKSIDFSDSDEGLVVTCDNNIKLEFGFSGCEGSLKVEQYNGEDK